MRLPTKEMREHPLFAWLPEEGFETFEACFDMEAENLGAGERRESRGRLGYLLSGRLHTADGEAVRPGELFGPFGGWRREVPDRTGPVYCDLDGPGDHDQGLLF